MKISVKEIAGIVQGKVEGDDTVMLDSFAPIEEAGQHSLTFLSNPKYEQYMYSTQAAAVLVNEDFQANGPLDATLIRVSDVYTSLSVLLDLFNKSANTKKGIEQPSYIAEGAEVSEDAYVGAFAYIGKNVKVGPRTQIYPHVYIGDNTVVGVDTVIYSGVKIYAGMVIGNNCIIHSGAVIGSDGFGFAPQPDGSYKKVPQTGNVVLKDNVEIGANTTIDRATIKSTLIEEGVKLDNLIQVAHNVEIGAHTVIAAQTGISGSTKLGANCVVGGQVGIVGHISVADGSQIGAQSGISKEITEKGRKWFGSPAEELRQAMKMYAIYRKLPEIYEDVKALKTKLTD